VTRAPTGRSVPWSTYRVQVTEDFTLAEAAALIPYLTTLGVGALYLSPLLQATSGSAHGYDVVDHDQVDEGRGGRPGLEAVASACAASGLGLVIDIVPNHMGVAVPGQNRAWWDLLRLGLNSPTAGWFDIDWDHGHQRLLLPVLGDEADLDRDLRIEGDELTYFDHRYPLSPEGREVDESPAEAHARQQYELISFRRADTDQNYRRFFAVTDLAGLRVEDDDVFTATHGEILRWVTDYGVNGLRIDHPDGLADPGGYLNRLTGETPGVWLTVEKITEQGERIPPTWPVAGTTGYDALAEVTAVLVDPEAEGAVDDIYRQITGDERQWADHVELGKRTVSTTILQAEFRRLARLVPGVEQAADALVELAVAFPVYRSYLPEGAQHLEEAVARAGARRPDLREVAAAILPRLSDPSDELCVRFQQLTGAVMAKGVEDTAYYRYSRFVALNEVGGDPGRFGCTVDEFHRAQAKRQEVAPTGMTTLSTHDTKRGEDLRARLAVLAEVPDEWRRCAMHLAELAPIPNPAFGYLLWQTFIATGLIERGRMHAYAEKAMREAGIDTGWIDPHQEFEQAVHRAVDTAYDDAEARHLITAFSERIRPFGWSNSLAQKLVQLTMPGVPDIYQGSELSEESLVDPDNRRPVDFGALAHALGSVTAAALGPAAGPEAKLWLTWRALAVRRGTQRFTGYTPLTAAGHAADHLIAYDRGGAVTMATRLPVGLDRLGGWGGTQLALPDGDHIDVLTGRRFSGATAVADLLDAYPVALLIDGEVG
jgi:(1->4)-alpha-D-glucan 1-alpha-D-glucosylmutase